MNVKKLFLPLVTVFVIAFSSCYYDNMETLYPVLNSTCDTTAVTFSTSIAPLLSSSCYSCHSNATAASFGSNIKMESYADVKTNAVAIAGSIKHTGSYSPMPKNGGQLNTCSIQLFDIWVRRGMLNN
jgi:hypothetical protein